MNVTNPKLSVITIVYNNVQHIERTMLSVIHQTYSAIEYIIIDGASKDGTLNIIEKYQDHLAHIISEPDKGIYDAMNKGLKLASGDYVLFMNSGDEIFSPETVAKVFAKADDADIYYGETELVNESLESLGRRKHKTPEHFTWKSFKYGMNVSHQAIYVKREIAELYDLDYKLSADIDWVLKAALKAKKIVNTHIYVAKFLVGGASKQRHLESLKERYRIFKKYYGFFPNLINHAIIAIRLGFYSLKNRN